MKLLGCFLALGVVPIAHITCAQVTGGDGWSARTTTRFAEKDILEHSPTASKTIESNHALRFRDLEGDAVMNPSGRRLQDITTVDVMVLYSTEALSEYELTDDELVGMIEDAYKTSNTAMKNSEIDLELNLVHVGLLPYEQETTEDKAELQALNSDSAVADMRNQYRADLVQLIGHVDGGLAMVFNGEDTNGFSVNKPDSFDTFGHTHELAHNFGCHHNRARTDVETDYSHGLLYCGGDDDDDDVEFRTIMAKMDDDCDPDRINVFSNPDVTYENVATGVASTNDNAQTIRDNMVVISQFRECVDDGTACTTDYECCSDTCLEGVCVGSVCPSAGDIPGIESPEELREEGHACCPEKCGECGGVGCSGRTGFAAECCISAITEGGNDCSITNEAPCYITTETRSTCSNGFVGAEGKSSAGEIACCSLTCLNDDGVLECGGPGCGTRGGGAADCCIGKINEEGGDCATVGAAPCFIASSGEDAQSLPSQTGETGDTDTNEKSNGALAASTSSLSVFAIYFSLSVVMYVVCFGPV